ncbi:lysophospholipid acyltransferase family protein [Ideonella sp.]|uniref:lysophospholipid acyltransferase family protein n=1 Tax=Ideonella sp. TaxID=1929293 RepID=UPI003BB70D60
MTFLLRWISRWPLGWVQALGAAMGWLAWALSPTYRKRLALNARLAGLTDAQIREAVLQAGRMSAETPWLWFRPASRPLAGLMQWQGLPCVEQALAERRGLVLLTPHLGSFEIAGRAYAERFGAQQPLTALYRPAKQAFMAKIQTYVRTAPGLSAAPANLAGVRQMLRALRRGETVGLLPDQVPPKGQGVWVPFFGQRAYTMTLAARLVQQTGCTVLLAWAERLPGGRGFRMCFAPLPEPLPATSAGEEAAALSVNRAMEWVIAGCPAQYLWGYNRYKGPRDEEALRQRESKGRTD